MLPELAASYGLGMASSSVLGGLVYFKNNRRRKSRSMQLIQANLKLKQRMWSFVEASIVSDSEELQKIEQEKAKQTLLIILVAGIFLSWLGFFFLLILFFSPLTRNERKILSSALAKKILTPQEVEDFIEEF